MDVTSSGNNNDDSSSSSYCCSITMDGFSLTPVPARAGHELWTLGLVVDVDEALPAWELRYCKNQPVGSSSNIGKLISPLPNDKVKADKVTQKASELHDVYKSKTITQDMLLYSFGDAIGVDMKDTTGSSASHSPQQQQQYKQHSGLVFQAVWTAHLPLVNVEGIGAVGHMSLQQFVYPAISILFRVFSVHWTDYRSDQDVECCYLIQSVRTKKALRFVCKADATVVVPRVNLIIAMMQLKRESTAESEREMIMFKCLVITCTALLAMQKAGCTDIAIPFVIGYGNNVKLYATRFSDDGHVIVQTVEKALFHDATAEATAEKHRLLTKLMILLSNVVKSARQNVKQLKQLSARLPVLEPFVEMDANDAKTKGRNAHHREAAARQVAERNGHIQRVCFPWLRAGHSDWDRFQQESPFFFRGEFHRLDNEFPLKVFCKVWREGDRRTKRNNVSREIDVFRLANQAGVPTPQVLENLTCLDIDHINYGETCSTIYHVLAVEFKVDNRVTMDDILQFALSLVQAVRKLHSIGILHCDIKPANILWDASEKVVKLVDFGHAQEIDGAISYNATEPYQAPEVSDGEPHSESSDAYSVGKTLKSTLKDVETSLGGKGSSGSMLLVSEVASLLVQVFASERMQLIEAEEQLRLHQEGKSTSLGSVARKIR